jgi:hypothetical protein
MWCCHAISKALPRSRGAIPSRRIQLRSISRTSPRCDETKHDTQLIPLLERIRDGTLSPEEACRLIQQNSEISQKGLSSESTLEQFANLDHDRAQRTGFPEAVFAQGKTADQVAFILDDMAQRRRNLISSALHSSSADGPDPSDPSSPSSPLEANAILATRYEYWMGMSCNTSAQLFLRYGVRFVLSLPEYHPSYTMACKSTTSSMEPLHIIQWLE